MTFLAAYFTLQSKLIHCFPDTLEFALKKLTLRVLV